MQLPPFFTYFGSKWSATRRGFYPQPVASRIVEPFAGSAGYSLNYSDLDVLLVDSSEHVVAAWTYLIRASSRDILSLPILEPGQKVSDLNLDSDARAFLGFCVNIASAAPRNTVTLRGATASNGWTERRRDRVANHVQHIRHWRVLHAQYVNIPNNHATWFVDPPYEGPPGRNYPEQVQSYADLGSWCRTRQGQVIVCENEGARWLPFRRAGTLPVNMHGRGRQSVEVTWTKGL